MKTSKLLLASTLLVQSVAVFAQDETEDLVLAYGDNATVSIATGSKQSLRNAPAVATVITAEEIAAMGATDLDQVMETVPGVHVSHPAPHSSSTYEIRGIVGNPTNPQVLILQNGVPINSVYRGDKGEVWGNLPLENIARIEIIRGPGSALYGADAFSGVINIVTKTAADTPGTEFGARAGAFNTKDAWVQHGGKMGAMDVTAYLRLGSSDGSREVITADAQTLRDRAFGTHASLAPGAIRTGYDAVDGSLTLGYDKWQFHAGYKKRDKVGLGAGIGSAVDPVGAAKSERITTDLSWTDDQFAKDWGVGVTGSYLHYTEAADSFYQIAPPGSRFPTGTFTNGMIGNPSRAERQIRLSAFATYTGFEDHSLRFGIGHDDLNLYEATTNRNYTLNAAGVPVRLAGMTDLTGTDQNHVRPARRKNSYVNVQDEWKFAQDWMLTAGIRHDNYSDFGGTTNPRAALVWDAKLDLTAKLLFGRAYRAPSFLEQYGNNAANNGNPNLRPELIDTWETAFSWQVRPDTQINLSFFRYNMRDVIRAIKDPAPAPGSTYQNTGKQHGSGMEIEAVWDASRSLRLTGNYAYQRSIDEATNTDAGYAPHHHIYARADWRFSGPWTVSSQVNYVAARKRAFGDVRPDIPDYTTVDVTLRTTGRKDSWAYAASIRNLFNAQVLEPTLAPGTSIPNDLPQPRRSFYLQATYSL